MDSDVSRLLLRFSFEKNVKVNQKFHWNIFRFYMQFIVISI